MYAKAMHEKLWKFKCFSLDSIDLPSVDKYESYFCCHNICHIYPSLLLFIHLRNSFNLSVRYTEFFIVGFLGFF